MTALRQELRRWVPAGLRMRLRPPPAWTVSVIRSTSPLALRDPSATTTAVVDPDGLDQLGLALVADPFALWRDGRWYLFVEALERGHRSAAIGLFTSDDLERWSFDGPVLTEPFHLSYPCIVTDDDGTYLIPESYATASVRLYRAVDFPRRWTLDTVLLDGAPFKDATPFRHDDRWWMFVETSQHAHDQLRLYHAEQLRGPWREHPASPLVGGDPTAARPGGRPVRVGDTLVRFAQDCGRSYGRAARAFEVLELSPTTYRERPIDPEVIGASGNGFNARASHHVDAHRLVTGGWACFVDGHR